MTVIGFHCSHEPISPAQLLRDVQHAERAGFTGAGEQLRPTAPATTMASS